MSGPRDWDKELAAIDRAIERAPPVPAPHAEPGTARARVQRGAASRVWVRLLPVLVLGAALPFWPYVRACGTGLVLYLAAVGILVGAATWAAVSAWRHGRPAAHVLALAAIVWGGVLVAREVLPRVGYARMTAAWTC